MLKHLQTLVLYSFGTLLLECNLNVPSCLLLPIMELPSLVGDTILVDKVYESSVVVIGDPEVTI